ncbi:MAG: RNA polymerase sigma factor (sigma-70 family) [Limisphaerales bacterium]|jgi:RNA polymerase sigma factor (sigma-70 family)
MNPEPPQSAENFRTTWWTQVSRSKADSPAGRRALGELCEAYYEPVTAFLRCEVHDSQVAGDLAQDFFAKMLQGGSIARADQGQGRFRSYLLGAVKHFLSHYREAKRRRKRGGGVEDVSLYDTETGEIRPLPDGRELSPDAAFDRQWALTVLARTLEALRLESDAAGRAEFFEQVKPWLTGEAARGDQSVLAEKCGMNANALKVAVHRLKRRFRDLLKAEIAGTLDDPDSIDGEMQALFAALGR